MEYKRITSRIETSLHSYYDKKVARGCNTSLLKDDFGARWIKTNVVVSRSNELVEGAPYHNNNITYGVIMAKIEKYVSIMSHNQGVKDNVISFLDNCDALNVVTETLEPITISQRSRIQNHPSKNVLTGKQSTRRRNKCSICHELGHTRRTHFKRVNRPKQ